MAFDMNVRSQAWGKEIGTPRHHAVSVKLKELQSQHKSFGGTIGAALTLWSDGMVHGGLVPTFAMAERSEWPNPSVDHRDPSNYRHQRKQTNSELRFHAEFYPGSQVEHLDELVAKMQSGARIAREACELTSDPLLQNFSILQSYTHLWTFMGLVRGETRETWRMIEVSLVGFILGFESRLSLH